MTLVVILLAVVIVILQVVWGRISFFVYPLLLFLFVLTGIRIIKECKKYGTKNVFSAFNKPNKITNFDYITMMLGRLDGHIHILEEGTTILFIHTSGLYYFHYFNADGVITQISGQENFYQKNGNQQGVVFNFLPSMEEKIKLLEEKYQKQIKPYIVTNNSCSFHISTPESFKVVHLIHIYYQMVQECKKQIYTQEEVEQMSNNVKNDRIA